MLSGERSFFIECNGEGDLFFNLFGALIEKDINGSFTVDTGHMVAWEPSLTYSIRGLGGLKSTLLSGEGVAMRFFQALEISSCLLDSDALNSSVWTTP